MPDIVFYPLLCSIIANIALIIGIFIGYFGRWLLSPTKEPEHGRHVV